MWAPWKQSKHSKLCLQIYKTYPLLYVLSVSPCLMQTATITLNVFRKKAKDVCALEIIWRSKSRFILCKYNWLKGRYFNFSLLIVSFNSAVYTKAHTPPPFPQSMTNKAHVKGEEEADGNWWSVLLLWRTVNTCSTSSSIFFTWSWLLMPHHGQE